ncbi:xanthine dehydrogenase family protein subunit M [Candidatus Izemoplasma sp. B36]|uniref:FAD binding domain-containing protein n=1 Tax=Candidatus Izemoplasma sp. B36 TaxID=3242468 RepID=UPI0035586AE0
MLVTKYLRPESLSDAYKVLTEEKKSLIIAGGAWIKLSIKKIDTLISIDNLNLNQIEITKDSLEIGSMVTLRELEINKEVNELYDGILARAIHKIMGINIRNIATIGGSIMGKFPFSDIIPALLVMDTKLIFYKQGEITLEEYLETPKMEKDILLKVIIKKEKGVGFFKKVAKTPLDFSIINIAISKCNNKFKVCLGSTPYLAKLAINTMEYLNKHSKISEEIINSAIKIMIQEIKFNKNVRSSKEYKEELAKVYLKRGLKKVIAHVG